MTTEIWRKERTTYIRPWAWELLPGFAAAILVRLLKKRPSQLINTKIRCDKRRARLEAPNPKKRNPAHSKARVQK